MMSFAAVYVSLALLFHRSSVEAKCEKPGYFFLGDEVKIICEIQGTYSWPEWTQRKKWKNDDPTTITNEGSSLISPVYAARFSYDTDNKTLIITNVEKSDEGVYVCQCAEKEDSPKMFELFVIEKMQEIDAREEPINARGIKNAVVAFFALAIMVLVVVIIRQCFILIRIYKKIKRTENIKGRKNVFHIVIDEARRSADTSPQCTSKLLTTTNMPSIQILILIIAVIFFMTVLVWFIVIQKTEEDCEKVTNVGKYASLLTVEIIAIVLGVIILVYAYIDKCLSELPVGKSTTPDSPTLHHKNSGEEQISEEQQLPGDGSDEDPCLSKLSDGKSTTSDSSTVLCQSIGGNSEEQQLPEDEVFKRLSFVRNTIHQIFESAFPGYFSVYWEDRLFLFEEKFNPGFMRMNPTTHHDLDDEGYNSNKYLRILGEIINILEDIIEQTLEKRKRGDSVSPQYWETDKINVLKAKFYQLPIYRGGLFDRNSQHARNLVFVEGAIIGHQLMKLTSKISTQDGCVSNISKTDHCVIGLPSPTGGDHSQTELQPLLLFDN